MSTPLLEVTDLHTHLPTEDGLVRAVDGVSFTIRSGETVCLVGESGSGKTLTCDTITGLVSHPDSEISGEVVFDGEHLSEMSDKAMQSIRGNRIAYVFQNAQSALDPVYTIGEQITEAITFHENVGEEEARHRAIELLRTVELSRPEDRVDQYPHEFSDGMCQRAAIAIALAGEPDLLIADEPTSALDVTIQARIIELLKRIQSERQLSVLLVTHDLRVVSALGDRLVVLYDGAVAERGTVAAVFEQPGHPYTQALLRSFSGEPVRATVSNTDETPDGCRFRNECPHAIEECATERPSFYAVDEDSSHEARCLFYESGRDRTTVLDEAPDLGSGTPAVQDTTPRGGTDD